METKPDGLAVGKQKLFQTEPRADEPCPVIYEYYTEYGDDGIVTIVIEGVGTQVPVHSLMAFVDFFRKECQEKGHG